MTKKDLVKAMATKAGTTQKDMAAAVDALTAVITETLAKGEDVALVGFGAWKVKDVPASVKRNPQTGEPINVEAHKRVAFKAGTALKETVKNA